MLASLCVLPSVTNMETNKKSGRGQILFTAWTSRKKCVGCIWTSLLRHPVVYLLYSTHSILWYSEPSNNYSCCLCVKPKIWTVTTGSRPSSVLLLRFIKCSWVFLGYVYSSDNRQCTLVLPDLCLHFCSCRCICTLNSFSILASMASSLLSSSAASTGSSLDKER